MPGDRCEHDHTETVASGVRPQGLNCRRGGGELMRCGVQSVEEETVVDTSRGNRAMMRTHRRKAAEDSVVALLSPYSRVGVDPSIDASLREI